MPTVIDETKSAAETFIQEVNPRSVNGFVYDDLGYDSIHDRDIPAALEVVGLSKDGRRQYCWKFEKPNPIYEPWNEMTSRLLWHKRTYPHFEVSEDSPLRERYVPVYNMIGHIDKTKLISRQTLTAFMKRLDSMAYPITLSISAVK